jgi:GABA permease
MAFDRSARSQLWLSLLSWAVVIGLYFAARARGRIGARSGDDRVGGAGA